MKKLFLMIVGISFLLASPFYASAQKKKAGNAAIDTIKSSYFGGLKFRGIGPAFASGRIADFSVNPDNPSEYYVAVAAGNVFKTTNSGITWQPIFDNYGSWSIADVEIDPTNSSVVWVGTGEYNSQRAIGYGDGVYKSEDGGSSFKNMGLSETEHIGRILIDPRDGNVVYVAAQGPLWGAGGERGLYKTVDGGKTWNKILEISENTGVTDIVLDIRNPDVLYAASYQRRRHVFTLINGGPESAIYKSTDAGKTWNKLTKGLPSGDVGRIGLAISSVNPDYVFAIIEAEGESGGFFRSTNRGASWSKMNDYVSTSPQYYNRIYCDPKDVDKVYSVDTWSKVTTDGGKTWNNISNNHRHVDDHCLWINPNNTKHLLIGGDGGIYESFDEGKYWDFKENLPVTQFYRVSVDNSEPFYYVYGGTQDNNSMGGPSRTTSSATVSDDWFVTNGGDGFETAIDPLDQNIVYAQSQYGGLVRYDRRSGEAIDIQPIPPSGEAYRWNWNSPIIVSPNYPCRLYFAANKLFKSDDRGNTWETFSPDLTRQIDRNKLPVFGKIQSPEAVAKNASTSLFGNIVALDESPVQIDLLYVGTDDGLIQVSEDAGKSWKTIESFPGIPDMTYVSFILASSHQAGIVYATFDGRKQNDLNPYVLRSEDKGMTWQNITANLPKKGTVYTIAEDHIDKNLLFVGTEFGVFFSPDMGKQWIELKNGLPTTCVMDMAIQKRENDLVLATFGRGFYILEDYSPLRNISSAMFEKESILFPVKDALLYTQTGVKYGQGETYFTSDNPDVQATFTFYLKETPKALKSKRKEAEKAAVKSKKDIDYPDMNQLRAEDDEEKPYLLFTITGEQNEVIRKLKFAASKGINRYSWDLRYPSSYPVRATDNVFANGGSAMPVAPGLYKVQIDMVDGDNYKNLQPPAAFRVKALDNTTLPATDRNELVAFQAKVQELGRVCQAAFSMNTELEKNLSALRQAVDMTPAAPHTLLMKVKALQNENLNIGRKFKGDESIAKRNENQPPSISERLSSLVWGHWRSTSAPTTAMVQGYDIILNEFTPLYDRVKEIIQKDVKAIEKELDALGAPYTTGRFPELKN